MIVYVCPGTYVAGAIIAACPVWPFALWQDVHVDSPGAPVRDAGAPPSEACVVVTDESANINAKTIKAENVANTNIFKDRLSIFILLSSKVTAAVG